MILWACRTLVQLVFMCVFCCSQVMADSELVNAFRTLNANARLRLVKEIPVNFPTHHPQGMTISGERIYVSSVEVIQRAKGIGKGHLFEMDFSGRLLRTLSLGEGSAYHPGGIDFDGERIWVPVAEYRPDSSTIVYSVNPGEMSARKVFNFPDHLGVIVHDREHHQLIAMSWGARRVYRWKMIEKEAGWVPENPSSPDRYANPNHYVDYQDCQTCVGVPFILCSGVKHIRGTRSNPGGWTLGGIDLIDLDTLQPLHQIPIRLQTPSGLPMTQNPFYVRPIGHGLRFYFMPEDNGSTIYVYETSVSRESQESP